MTRDEPNQTSEFERALAAAGQTESPSARFVLRLYVAGSTPRSTRALRNIRSICEEHLKGRYELEVIDIYQQPELASSANLLAAPTLIRELPGPVRRMIGDFSDTERVLVGLNILPAS